MTRPNHWLKTHTYLLAGRIMAGLLKYVGREIEAQVVLTMNDGSERRITGDPATAQTELRALEGRSS